MKKKWIYWGIGFVLIIPFVINTLILCPAHFPFVGNATNWLAFWGSYLGGGLAAIVGFVTLYHSAKRQNLQLQISNKQKELSILQNKLAECVCAFNYSRLCSIVLYINDPSKYNLFIADMEQYSNELTEKSNAFGMFYVKDKNKRQTAARFLEQFEENYRLFNTNITNLSVQVSNLRDTLQKHKIDPLACSIEEHPQTKEFHVEIVQIAQNQKIVSQKLEMLFQAAQDWIKEEENEIGKLQQQLI